ncbi:MAG: hypothetical protein OXG27_14430 [Chloroflexi bacterium]|nr:hypothetical protein [Chloroflexota bacterium]
MTSERPRNVDKVELLAQAVSRHVADGYRVESQSDVQAIMNKRVVSFFRAVICAVVWWPGFFLEHHKKDHRVIIRIDDTGNALIQEA